MTREELIKFLTILKEQARNSGANTYVWDVKIDSFNFVIDMAIKALEQEPKSEWEHDHEILRAYSDGASEVLDKISAEIEELFSYVEFDDDTKTSYNMVRLEEVQRVIDKYKAESEVEDGKNEH